MPKVETGDKLLRRWRGNRTKTAAAQVFGVSRQTYDFWESGERAPDAGNWFRLHQTTLGAVPWYVWPRDPSVIPIVFSVIGAPMPEDAADFFSRAQHQATVTTATEGTSDAA